MARLGANTDADSKLDKARLQPTQTPVPTRVATPTSIPVSIPATPAAAATIKSSFVDSSGATITVYSDGTTTKTLPIGIGQSAKDIVNGFLKDAGMEALSGEAWKQWGAGTSAPQIMDYIRGTSQYAAKFPAMKTLNSQGRNISEATYMAKEAADRDLLKSYGVPSGIFDTHEYLGSLMTNNVNQADLQQRLNDAQDTILSKDPSILKYGQDTYGLGVGDLMAGYLDPTLALPVIEQRSKAIKIGGSAIQAGFGTELSKGQSEALATQGITQAQALQGFTNLGQQTQFGQELKGDESGSLTQQQMIDAQFGSNAAAQTARQNVQAKRLATFNEGGNFASSQGGVTGLGSAGFAS